MSRTIIGRAVPKSAPAVTRALQKLTAPDAREIIMRADGNYALTPNGNRKVYNELARKMTLED